MGLLSKADQTHSGFHELPLKSTGLLKSAEKKKRVFRMAYRYQLN